jgi:phage baseplate assembly protein W
MQKIVNYRDLDLNFNRHPLTNDVTQLTESESVKRALRNVLSFKRYEKPFHPEINSGIYDSLFENVSSLQLDAMKTAVQLLVKKYEPRVILYDVVILPNLDGNSFSVTLTYSIINIQTPVSFTFNVQRNR